MSESSNRQQLPEDDWTQILQKINWRSIDLTLHAKSETEEEVSAHLPTISEIAEKPLTLPDSTTIYKDEEDRLIKRILLDGSTSVYTYEGISKIPAKITLNIFSGPNAVEYTAVSLKEGEYNYSFIGSVSEAKIFHNKAIKGLLPVHIEVFAGNGRPAGVIHSDGSEFEYGNISPAANHLKQSLIEIESYEDSKYFGKLNNPQTVYEISSNISVIEIGTHGKENVQLSAPAIGVNAKLSLSGSRLYLKNEINIPIYVFRKGGKKIPISEGESFPLVRGDRLQLADKKTLVDIERIGNKFRLSGGKQSTLLQKETPYIVTDLHFTLGNHGADYEVTNIAGAKVDISPVINNLSGFTAEMHNSGTKPIRIGRGSETILLSPGERTGIEDDDLLSYDLDTKLKFNHTSEGLVMEMVAFRDKTAGTKIEIDEVEAYILQSLVFESITTNSLIRRHVSNVTLEKMGFLRLEVIGHEEEIDNFDYYFHELTKMQVQKFQDKITEIRLPSRERTSGPSLAEMVISIDWYGNNVERISITSKKGYVDVLKHLIPGRREKSKLWKKHAIVADESLPEIPENHLLLAKCVKFPSQIQNLEIPVSWSDNPEEVAGEALPDGKVIYVLMPQTEADLFKCIVGDKTKYIFSLASLQNQNIREHIYSPNNINNTGEYWVHVKERFSINDTISGIAITTAQLLKSTNIDISRFGLIIRNQNEYNSDRTLSNHPVFTLSRPRARHCIGLGQRFKAGSDKNSEILIANAFPSHFDIIFDNNAPRLAKYLDIPSGALKVVRSGEKVDFGNELELMNEDKIIVISENTAGKCHHRQLFDIEINSDKLHLHHISSLIKTHSITNYASSLNPRLNEFRTAIIEREKITNKLSVESLIFSSKSNYAYRRSSQNEIDFNPDNTYDRFLNQKEFVWIEDPNPFRNDPYKIIHHTIVDFGWEARVLSLQEGMLDISSIADAEKVGFLRTAASEDGSMEFWLSNPYSSDELLLLREGEPGAFVVEGGPETRLNYGDTFFANQHAFTMANVDEFDYYKVFSPRINLNANPSMEIFPLLSRVELTDQPLLSVEAEAYVVPLKESENLLGVISEDILIHAELRLLAGEVVVPVTVPCEDGEERIILFTIDSGVFPANILVSTIIRRAKEENIKSIAMPILSSEDAFSNIHETVVSHIEGIRSANTALDVVYTLGSKYKQLGDLVRSEVALQNGNLAYSKARAQFLKLLEKLQFEISIISSDIFIPLDSSNSLINTMKNIKQSIEKFDFSIVEPLTVAEDLNDIMNLLGLADRFVFLQQTSAKGNLLFLLKDKITQGYWKDAAVIEIGEQFDAWSKNTQDDSSFIEELTETIRQKKNKGPDVYISGVLNIIKNLKNAGERAETIEVLLNKTFRKEGLRHLLLILVEKDRIKIRKREYCSNPPLTIFAVDTGLKTEIDEMPAEPDTNISQKDHQITSGEGLEAVKQMRDFLGAEQARKLEERISVEYEGKRIDGTVILRLNVNDIAIVKLDEPKSNLDTIEIPSWKNYSDLPIFHYGGRSYRYKINGTVYTAIKGKIEVAADLQALRESASGQST